jgi:hypothetical protein
MLLSRNKSKFTFENVVKPILGLGGNFFMLGSSTTEPMTKKSIVDRVTRSFRDNKFKSSIRATTLILPTSSINTPRTTMTANESS